MSDLNDNREGGLFSDDYEIPKRENPYKKKKKTEKTDDPASVCVFSEDKPRETKRENPYKRKSPVKENTEEVENTDVVEAPPVNNSGLYRDERGFHLPKHERSLKDRWDAFIFNHVKLICFIGGVMAVLLRWCPHLVASTEGVVTDAILVFLSMKDISLPALLTDGVFVAGWVLSRVEGWKRNG